MSKNDSIHRREFLKTTGTAVLGGSTAMSCGGMSQRGPRSRRRPNVVLIMTDDQGYGDVGCHGNDKIRTPNMDRVAREGVEFTQFCVSPVCAPTRACLMTGRYNYRTAAIDTWLGRAMMHPEEVTLGEMLGDAGYRTGIFGKWHLGDNYPLRPQEHGFQEVLIHRGGGMCQPSEPPGSLYQDPILQHNGIQKQYSGYCTDIFTDATIRFIEENRNRPFFAYLAPNAPHTPLQIDERYVEPYRKMGIDEDNARVYGMVENIDENIGRILRRLRELELEEDTLLIFMTDNGPQQPRYTAGLRGRKGTVYEGGIRVPFFARWTGTLEAGRKVDRMGAHLDVAPTLLDICGAKQPKQVAFDGVSLAPLMFGRTTESPDRTLYFQWHRGDVPEPFRACAARSQRYKLINGQELYDLENDPGEKNDIAERNPEIVEEMRRGYTAWFEDVSSTRGYDPPRIHLGTPHENPVVLTRQDWRGPRAGWGKDSLGHWEVEVAEAGVYDIHLRFRKRENITAARFRLGHIGLSQDLPPNATSCTFNNVRLPVGPGRLEAWLLQPDEKSFGVNYVDVKRKQ